MGTLQKKICKNVACPQFSNSNKLRMRNNEKSALKQTVKISDILRFCHTFLEFVEKRQAFRLGG